MTVLQLGTLAAPFEAFAWHGHLNLGLLWPGILQTEPGASAAQECEARPTERAFAAILESGAVLNWGSANWGGDNSQVKEQLRKVQCILLLLPSLDDLGRRQQQGARAAEERQAQSTPFAAILEYGMLLPAALQEKAETAAKCKRR